MSRISSCFDALRQDNRKGLITYVTAGDPDPDQTVDILHVLADNGADLLELGVPFSDPMADGPVVQAACERALAHHVSLDMILGMVARFREVNRHTPVILMGYLNPVLAMGVEVFAQRAAEAGVDGVLIVDLTPEESSEFTMLIRQHGMDCIFLVAPNTAMSRLGEIASHASGFIYYVSLKGVTGADSLDVNSVSERVSEIRQFIDLPVAVGFGIRNENDAKAISGACDAVVLGSALVKQIEQHRQNRAQLLEQLKTLTQTLRKALDG